MSSKEKIDLLIIRPSNIYGPHDKFDKEKSKVIPSIIRKCLESKKKLLRCGRWFRCKRFYLHR